MLKLYNTLSRKIEDFKALDGQAARIYSCGLTVYDFAHIGNFRAFIFADMLKRVLKYNGYAVTHVMNITDVGHLTGDRDMGEDKLAAAAARRQKTAWEVASYFTEAFLSDIKELNVILPDKLPKATDHIKDMIELIQILEQKGYTYKTTDGLYFDTGKISDYGKLALLDLKGLREGARVERNPEKRNPTDFALWKFSPAGAKRDMEWQSPWGVGFPGWHIECSAMSVKYLGQPFDIHTGGIDHVPVHHTNEIAQTEAATGRPLANFWMHNEHLLIADEKIAKSAGNSITLSDIKKRNCAPLAFRYFVLLGHYRARLNFTWEALAAAQNALDNLYAAAAAIDHESQTGCPEFERQFAEALDDDLNTPEALAAMWNMLKADCPPEAKLHSLFEFDKALGLSIRENRDELRQPLPEDIKKLVAEREETRRNQDWGAADKIRDELLTRGYEIKDTDRGPRVMKATRQHPHKR